MPGVQNFMYQDTHQKWEKHIQRRLFVHHSNCCLQPQLTTGKSIFNIQVFYFANEKPMNILTAPKNG